MTDRYTKLVLTVIAASLVVIALEDLPFLRTASAQTGKIHVIVDAFDSSAFNYAFQYVQTPLPVKIHQ
jgi:hypothetical protein